MRELEFSDEVQADILKSVETWGNECKKQSAFESLPKYVKKEFDTVITCFSEMMYGYHLQSPNSWTAVALEDVLVDVFPSKMLMPETFFKAVDPVLTFFVGYLRQTGVLDDRKAQALTNGLKKAVPVMRQRAKDTPSFSPMKQLLMEGMEQGVDIPDMDALNSVLKEMDMSDLFAEDFPPAPVRSQKIGRNEPCPCGSGKKYKKCCGSDEAKDSSHMAVEPAESVEDDAEAPTIEQWAQLYEIADKLKKLAPWEDLWDSEHITIMLPGRDEPVYCSVMGRIGECFAIGVYPGYESILGYYRMAQAPADEPPFIKIFDQKCLMCYFGDREELAPQEREILKTLEIKFRGRNQWIYFRSMHPGYYPWFISASQADILIQTLQNLTMAYLDLRDGKLSVDFDGGETLLRSYSPEKEMWQNTVTPKLPVPYSNTMLIVRDELLIARLKRQKKSGMRLEFDLVYFPMPIQEHKDDIPYLPRMALLADKRSGLPIDQHIKQPDEYIENVVLDMLCNHIMEYGRPAAIYVRSERTGRFLADMCEKIGVKLIDDEGVPAMNELLETLLGAASETDYSI